MPFDYILTYRLITNYKLTLCCKWLEKDEVITIKMRIELDNDTKTCIIE